MFGFDDDCWGEDHRTNPGWLKTLVSKFPTGGILYVSLDGGTRESWASLLGKREISLTHMEK